MKERLYVYFHFNSIQYKLLHDYVRLKRIGFCNFVTDRLQISYHI